MGCVNGSFSGSVSGCIFGKIPESTLPIGDAPVRAAGRTKPVDDFIVVHGRLDVLVLRLLAAMTQGSRDFFGAIEIRGMSDDRHHKFSHFLGRPFLGCYSTFVVEVVSGVDHVHRSAWSLKGFGLTDEIESSQEQRSSPGRSQLSCRRKRPSASASRKGRTTPEGLAREAAHFGGPLDH
jgi:hypothetical protein